MNKEALPSINDSIKTIARNMVDSMKLSDIKFGTVVGVDPLQIKIDSQEPLTESWLVLSNMVKDHYVDVTVSMQTENDAFLVKDHTHGNGNNGNPTTTTADFDTTHKHEIKHKIKMLQHYGLKKDEKVILLRMQGGRKYYVLDRVSEHICEGEWL